MVKYAVLVSVLLTMQLNNSLAYANLLQNLGASNSARPGIYGLPPHIRNLTDLEYVMEDSKLPVAQRTEVLLNWLEQERLHPSAVSTGIGGGPIDSDYIQAQIVKALCCYSDFMLLDALASSSLINSNARVAVCLALGALGDSRQIPNIVSILERHPNPRFRDIAIGDLYLLGAKETIPLIEQATRDQFSVSFVHSHRGPVTLYPVRETAARCLKNLGDPTIVASARKRNEEFASKLSLAKKSGRPNISTTNRLIAAANGKPLSAPTNNSSSSK